MHWKLHRFLIACYSFEYFSTEKMLLKCFLVHKWNVSSSWFRQSLFFPLSEIIAYICIAVFFVCAVIPSRKLSWNFQSRWYLRQSTVTWVLLALRHQNIIASILSHDGLQEFSVYSPCISFHSLPTMTRVFYEHFSFNC